MKFGLARDAIERIQSVFNRYPTVEKVVIYGSRAKGNYRVGSDIDLTLMGDNLTDPMLSAIKSDLDELNTPYLFDISIFNDVQSVDLKEHIARAGQVFYEKSGDRSK
ncbi:MAG: nucleotidyltransferase domain-containing protein [Pseudomonas sp.]|nr:nucleotidyltransferase domain-containing protein [Pseudomonas sp.]